MQMLPDPIPLEESRALARRLAEPIWEGFDDKSLAAKALVLRSLAAADPFGVLRKMDDVDPAGARGKSIIQAKLVPMLATFDPDQAIVAAKGRSSPSARATSLRQVVDALPESQRARKLAILDRMLTQAKAATTPRGRLVLTIDVAERWVRELGKRRRPGNCSPTYFATREVPAGPTRCEAISQHSSPDSTCRRPSRSPGSSPPLEPIPRPRGHPAHRVPSGR